MAVTINPNLDPALINKYNKTQGANGVDSTDNEQSGKAGGLSVVNGAHSSFASSNEKLNNSINDNDGSMVYKNSSSSAKASASAAADQGRNATNNAISAGDRGTAQFQESVNITQEHMNICDKQAGVAKASTTAANNDRRQAGEIQKWINSQQPTLTELVDKKQELSDEALSLVSEFGNFESIEEFQEFFQEQMDGVDMQEIQEAQEKKQAAEAELETLDENNPDDKVKIDQLNGEIADANGVLQNGNGVDLGRLSGIMEDVSTIQEDIGAIDEAIQDISTNIDAKAAKNEEIGKDIDKQEKVAKDASVQVTTSQDAINDAQTKNDDEQDKISDELQTAMNISQTVSKVGSATITLGNMMASNSFTAGAAPAVIKMGLVTLGIGNTGEFTTNGVAFAQTGNTDYLKNMGKTAISGVMSTAGAVGGLTAANAVSKAAKLGADHALTKAAEKVAEATAKRTAVISAGASMAGNILGN